MFREEDLEDYIITDSDEKREALYFLYLYHVNYDNEPNENKRVIREYYERELRYKGSFYKDAKIFRERGNPLNWETTSVTRFRPRARTMSYYQGMHTYDSFVYPTQTLVKIELSKHIDMILANREERIINLNLAFMHNLREELKHMQRLIGQIDDKNGSMMITKGWQSPEVYNLSDLQIVFKVNNNDYIRYLSTNYMSPSFVIEVAMNLLENYLIGVTKLGDIKEEALGRYEEYDEDFYIESCILERVWVNKRTNIYDSNIKRRQLGDYDLEIENLRSIRIKEVVAQ